MNRYQNSTLAKLMTEDWCLPGFVFVVIAAACRLYTAVANADNAVVTAATVGADSNAFSWTQAASKGLLQ